MQDALRKILVIDDEYAICQFISETVADIGFATETAVNGREGLAKFEQTGFRAVITDLWMPVMDGVSTIVAIRRKDVAIPIILMTGYDKKEQLIQAATEHGANCILKKPFSPADLIDALGSLIVNGEPARLTVH